MSDSKTYYKTIKSPVGNLRLIATDAGLAAVLWEKDDPERAALKADVEQPSHPILLEAEKQLAEYFEKRRTVFSITLDLTGTEFQKKVWEKLLEIPFGQTRTYGQIAALAGDPKSVRAVGGAANKNPVVIIVPCHRVIGATGKMVGFGGGVPNKELLLALENSVKPLTLWD